MIHPLCPPQVVLRFLSDSMFFQTVLEERDAKELVQKFSAKELKGMLSADDGSWVVDLDKVWCIHSLPLEAVQQQQSPPLSSPTHPWYGRSGN